MINVEKYISNCYKMIKLKSEDPEAGKVYADINFHRLAERASAYQQQQEEIQFAEHLFQNVSQDEKAAQLLRENRNE